MWWRWQGLSGDDRAGREGLGGGVKEVGDVTEVTWVVRVAGSGRDVRVDLRGKSGDAIPGNPRPYPSL